MTILTINTDGDLNAQIARDEVWRQAALLITEGLASETEKSRLLFFLAKDGYGAVRKRLVERQETLEIIQPLLDDFFAFEAAARL